MDEAILINVGNSHTELACWAGGTISPAERHPTARLGAADWHSELLPPRRPVPCVAASVVPSLDERLEQLSSGPITWLSAAMDLGVDFSLIDTSTIGSDRVANTVAAVHELALPAIVLDCGTTITTELIDAQRRFMGGAIVPGRRLSREALAGGTAQLPEIPMESEPAAAFGQTTAAAIRAGIDMGLLGAVDRILRESRALLEAADLEAVAIGGDRDYFAANLDNLRPGPDDFTLRGLAWAARKT